MTSIKLGIQSIASIHRKCSKVPISSCWQWRIQIFKLQVKRSGWGGGGVHSASVIIFISPSSFSAALKIGRGLDTTNPRMVGTQGRLPFDRKIRLVRRKHNGKRFTSLPQNCNIRYVNGKQHNPFKPEWTDYLKTYSSIFGWNFRKVTSPGISYIFSLKW